MLKTKMTELLGISYPIQCGTMQAITRAELVAAVANAGCFCCIPAATFGTKEELSDEIKKTKDLTDKPFGVNVSLFPGNSPVPHEVLIDTVIESGVKIMETAGRSPEPYRVKIKGSGVVHIHKCARVRDAAKVARLGVDMVSIVGTECGGHPSMEYVTSLVLVPQAVDAVDIPLIAGGGFSDGRSLMAALSLGADGVLMGTRFMGTKEAPIHDAFKQKMVESPETSTMIVMESIRNASRVIRNPWAEKILGMEKEGASLEDLMPYISGQISRKGWQEGNLDEGLYSMGQVVGRIRDIPTVAELVQRIVEEAKSVKKRLDQLMQA